MGIRGLAPTFDYELIRPPTHALNPINPDNARIFRITAAAGTELADAYSLDTVIIFSNKRSLQSENLHPPRGVAASGFPPLSNIPYCSLP